MILILDFVCGYPTLQMFNCCIGCLVVSIMEELFGNTIRTVVSIFCEVKPAFLAFLMVHSFAIAHFVFEKNK